MADRQCNWCNDEAPSRAHCSLCCFMEPCRDREKDWHPKKIIPGPEGTR